MPVLEPETVGGITPQQRYLWIYPDMPEVILFTKSETWCMILLDWPLNWVKEWRRTHIVNPKKTHYENKRNGKRSRKGFPDN